MKKLAKKIILIIMISFFMMAPLFSSVHADSGRKFYVSNSGNDSNSGLSESAAWKTLTKVNTADILSGDLVFFKTGNEWRGQLIAKSGVTYTAYGTGAKPLIMGSVSKGSPGDWIEVSPNVWTLNPGTTGESVLDGDCWKWYLHGEASADFSIIQTSDKIAIVSKDSGSVQSDLQLLSTSGLSIIAGRWYRLVFSARSTADFRIPEVKLMQSDDPWTNYADITTAKGGQGGIKISQEFSNYEVFFLANTTASDARITLYLGGAVPANSLVEFQDFEMREWNRNDNYIDEINIDVGNIIFDGNRAGWKRWSRSDLTTEGDFYWDPNTHRIYLYSVGSPTKKTSSIELALRRNIIEVAGDNVTIDGLDIRYGGAHGAFIENKKSAQITNCDFSWLGGGDQYGNQTVRFGNGVEFWNGGQDSSVTKCRFWEVYDAAFTTQSKGDYITQENIIFEDNEVYRCEYGFEFFSLYANLIGSSHTQNIYVQNNTIVDSGYGWGHTQRPDPSGIAIRMSTNTSTPGSPFNFFIENNILDGSRQSALYLHQGIFNGSADLTIGNNCYHQPNGGTLVEYFDGRKFTAEQFASYQKNTGKDTGSIIADPLFVDAAAMNFLLQENSPCITKGIGAFVAPVDDGDDDEPDLPNKTSDGGGGGGCFISSL